MEKLNINNLSSLIWVIETPEKDNTFTGAINDIKELVQINNFEILYNTENKIKESIDDAINFLNEMFELGIIQLPENYEHQLEQNIHSPVGRPTNIAHSKGVESTINDINPMLQDEKDKTVPRNNKITPPFIAENLKSYIPPANSLKKNIKKPATTKPTYTISENDRQILKELELPQNKQYIYTEVRRRFGRPVDRKILAVYGVNRFARSLETNYPNGYKKTEIKSILNLILNYDSYSIA